MTVEDKVRQNTARIITLEADVGALKVDTSKLNLKLDHQEERQEDRFKVLSTAQMDLKDIMKARQEADEKRAEEARKYRADREKQEHDANLAKQKWMQSLLTPQTMLLIIVILASIFGVKGIDMLEATTGAAQAPPQAGQP